MSNVQEQIQIFAKFQNFIGRDSLRKEMSRMFMCRCIVRFLQDKMGMNASPDEVISSWPRGLVGVAVNMVLNVEMSYTYVHLF